MVSLAETPLTGEPDAGEPPVRFGGRGGANPAIPTPIKRFATSEVPSKSRQRMDCGGLPPLCEVARVERGPASSRCHRAGVEAGLPTGCYHHGWKQGHSFLELEEGRCPWEMVAQEAV